MGEISWRLFETRRKFWRLIVYGDSESLKVKLLMKNRGFMGIPQCVFHQVSLSNRSNSSLQCSGRIA